MKSQSNPPASAVGKIKDHSVFNEDEVLHKLKHFLPAQSPLKDFIHHNTLHAFQDHKFKDAIRHASAMFGFNVSLSLEEYRTLYDQKQIRRDILEHVICKSKGKENIEHWVNIVRFAEYKNIPSPRIGSLRSGWKRFYETDLDAHVHPLLFKVVCSYLDQGISMWNFPVVHRGFLSSIRELERNSFSSFFKTSRARKLLFDSHATTTHLLKILVNDNTLYEQYLFDQQFAHQGWSGMVSTIEDQPAVLLDRKKISLQELIHFELLLEIDALDSIFRKEWLPLGNTLQRRPVDLFADVPETEYNEVLLLWQQAYEWTYYNEALAGIQQKKNDTVEPKTKSFQAMFCIDDRGYSLRHYLEQSDSECETFSTPGFFGVEFFYKPEYGKFYTKLCPAPITPKFLIKEGGTRRKRKKDVHFTKYTHALFAGWLISQTLGFWSAFKLFLNIFKPSISPATASSFSHMDKVSKLTIECKNAEDTENELQVGFTIEQMAQRVENLLKSIGLVKDFAPIVYVVGHGASSVNNPHYAAYDCGACSGRPGSVNARVFCFMANHPKVREILRLRGIAIPPTTQFIGGLHDTTRDEITFYDEGSLSSANQERHRKIEGVFSQVLDSNAKERSRRFELVNTNSSATNVHEKIKLRSVSLFEPRPELNHATNALCIVGRRHLTSNLFLDRRAFLNSYDYSIDPEGESLFTILKAAAPVCGGINLEYFFSRVDNQKLGAGTKLPHNVMGLFGVANGIEGDLRPGLPSQMIEVHDPIRLLMIVEHYEDVVLKTIQKSLETYEWFSNEWIHLVVVNPETKAFRLFRDGVFTTCEILPQHIESVTDTSSLFEKYPHNIPVHLIS
jgi:uncharacterized protein YbcC (UPF0753/DUF2309 family)